MHSRRSIRTLIAITAALIAILAVGPVAVAAAQDASIGPVRPAATATVDMDQLAAVEAAQPATDEPQVPHLTPGPLTPATRTAASVPGLFSAPRLAARAASADNGAVSPAPAQDFVGLDDIRNLYSGYRYIPPDTDGAVGLTKIMSGLNNNYRIFTKSTGAVLSTVGCETFWSGLGIAWPFDPKTLYDPINDRWIAVMLANDEIDAYDSAILLGLSETSDPSGQWSLYRITADPTKVDWADFPTVGFNKDFIAINVNMFGNEDWNYHGSEMLIVDYPQLRAGTFTGWMAYGTQYTASPGASYSPTDDKLYVVNQPWDAPGTYSVDTITRNPKTGAPMYTFGPARDRGLTWTSPWDNILPQKATAEVPDPMKIECQDDVVRSTPVVRDGSIYYTQTIGLPAGGTLSHTAILWTRLSAATGGVIDGGLIEDPTATADNGGKWYAYPHIAVNKAGDALVGFSEFSSAEWPSAAYAMRAGTDPAGYMRAPVVYKAGEDLYQKDYGSGRNRWGDYSKAQVDPSNDADLWVVDEYSKLIPTDNAVDKIIKRPGDWGGVWGTWWARVAPLSVVVTPTVAGGSGFISPATPQTYAVGSTPTFEFTAGPSFSLATVTVDGQPVTPTGNTYTFPPLTANHQIAVTYTTSVTYPITATAVTGGGSVSPAGTTQVPFLGNLTVAINAQPHYHLDRLLVDGTPVAPTSAYTFTSVRRGHRLQASFAIDTYTVTPSVVGGLAGHGRITPALTQTYAWGSMPTFRFTPDAGYAVFEVRVDGAAIQPTPRTSYTFEPLWGPHTISVRFVKNYVPAPQ